MDRCRQLGLRVTPQRLAVYRAVVESEIHPSAEDIHRTLRDRMPGLSLDTVYRTLLTFERHGLVRRLEVLDDRARFDGNLEDHHHLVCVRCRSVQDVRWPGVEALELPPEARVWGRVEGRHVEFRGVCSRCLAED